jgi:formiminoglutamase
VPASLTSITPTGAHATPGAVREALLRYSTYSAGHGLDVAALKAVDFGNVEAPDGPKGEARVREAVGKIAESGQSLLLALGGDNSITHSVMRGLAGDALTKWGLVTIDAHHDVRDGESNGSPVRRLVEAGLPGERIVQIGIADFANSAAYAQRVHDYGITVIERAQLRERPLGELIAYALGRAGEGGRRVFVDIDVDVCDRAEVPGCPASAPGGISADELRQIAFMMAADPRVRGIDITEVDATRDSSDQRTVRLAALLVLEIAAGLSARLGVGQAE